MLVVFLATNAACASTRGPLASPAPPPTPSAPPAATDPPAASAAVAPNATALTARVIDASVVEATTLGIAPPQPLSVLTVTITASNAAPDSPLAVGRTVQLLSKDIQLRTLKGADLTGQVALRGGPGQARFWLIEVTGTTPVR